ncbi:hypothetical protein HMPREF0973_01506 [Prevotella veroralis F0319]|uniref:Uncharacterized protein n=1 Tax=Prevotella veroralis F0319 TaxID=649761 RepID=C9MPG5_9BACT|nr:hypothetical protein HMPREF0973_01506 [Prevotella veroralis F0319]
MTVFSITKQMFQQPQSGTIPFGEIMLLMAFFNKRISALIYV